MRSGVLIGLVCVSCTGVLDEAMEEPVAEVVAPEPVIEEIPDAAPPELTYEPVDPDEPVGPLLLRLKTEPTSWGQPHSFARTDAGRGPAFSLYADGTLIWRTPGGLRRAHLDPASTDALHRALLDLGVGTIPSYERSTRDSTGARCPQTGGGWTLCKQGGTITLSDVDIEVWEIALPGGDQAVTRHYAGWAPGHDAELEAARSHIAAAINRADAYAEDYRAKKASLLLRTADWMEDTSVWPLDPALFNTTMKEGEVVAIVEGNDLTTLTEYVPGYGKTHFLRKGEYIEATVVPWLPDHDWRPAVEAFQKR